MWDPWDQVKTAIVRGPKERAQAGRQAVDKSRVRAEGFGASKPIADNASEEGRGKNRRVELVRVAA
ncbi:hypothetical protein [Cupriavidus basilensis]|uniref:hypothetical protein n=1 Tax=Cupriavidus basilensis TaxID=68895 RepID=UPI0039F66C53